MGTIYNISNIQNIIRQGGYKFKGGVSHTYKEWQELGYQVKAGEKAVGFTNDGLAWFTLDQVVKVD